LSVARAASATDTGSGRTTADSKLDCAVDLMAAGTGSGRPTADAKLACAVGLMVADVAWATDI
jgi:hypothetical protein